MLFLVGVIALAERSVAPYRDNADKIMSFASLICLMLLIYFLSAFSPDFNLTEKGVLIFFTFIPGIILLVWVFFRLLYAVVDEWKQSGDEEKMPKWKKLVTRVVYAITWRRVNVYLERQYTLRQLVVTGKSSNTLRPKEVELEES